MSSLHINVVKGSWPIGDQVTNISANEGSASASCSLLAHKLYKYNPDYLLTPLSSILDPARHSGSLSAYQERAGTKLESRASAIFTIFLGPNWSHIDLNSALIKLQKFKWNKLRSQQHCRKVMKESSILSCVKTSKTWQETNNRVIFHQVLHHTQCHNSYLNLSIGRTAVRHRNAFLINIKMTSVFSQLRGHWQRLLPQ